MARLGGCTVLPSPTAPDVSCMPEQRVRELRHLVARALRRGSLSPSADVVKTMLRGAFLIEWKEGSTRP